MERGCHHLIIKYLVDWRAVLLEDWRIGLVRKSGAGYLNAVSHKGSADWVDLGAQNVPKCGFEIADSRAVWRLCSKAAALVKEF